MPDVIVIGGAPGIGKSTLARHLRERFHSPWIDFGRLREFHLEPNWKNQNVEEEALSFENLLFIIRNYIRHGYSNVIVDDLKDERIQQMAAMLAEFDVRVLTLALSDSAELRRRIKERNDGWRDEDGAVEWNRKVLKRPTVPEEFKIDTAGMSPDEVANAVQEYLGSKEPLRSKQATTG